MSLPLDGVNVVSVAINLPGPLAAARLAELGASVTKVEPASGDPLAVAAPAWYAELVAHQTVVSLDVRKDREKFDELLADAHLLITSMRPSALMRLGLAHPYTQFPKLSLVEIVGHSGARAETPGHDLNYQAACGTLTPPHMPKVPIADILGAERTVSTALAAVIAGTVSGVGASYRVALEDAAAVAGSAVNYHLMGDGAILGGAFPGYGIYRAADGYVALGAVEPHFFMRALEVLGVDGTHETFAEAFSNKTIAELEALAAEHDLPLNGVN
ncbi:CoA transferase [Gordonia sp. (in: high G+C Gram-positive bacteria)]|uniref:CoA transferase n=1 Tax=Gordonia sp. (in: high G+C Gram-positive bacteria) TaxID=84139 RepID=UPI003F961414